MLSVRKEEGRIYIGTEYNLNFISKVKRIGGKWSADTREWHVSEEQENALNVILADVFGYSPNKPLDIIRVEYNAVDFTREGDVWIGNLCMVDRRDKVSPVSYHNETVVIVGGFPKRGGSVRYPMAKAEDGTVLRSDIPRGVYEQLSDEEKSKITVVHEQSKKDLLLKEKEQLLIRIAEIEQELCEL